MNRSDILRAFNRLTYHRGERYFREGRVRSLRAEPVAGGVLRVTSVTEGEQSYTQKIEVRDDGRRVLVSGDCSCPVGFNCKHVVASCLALAQEMASGEGVFGQSRTERWLEALTEAASAPAPPRSAPHLKPRFMTYVLDAPSLQTLSAGDNVLRDGVQIQLRVTRERASGSGLNKGTNVSPDTLRYTVELDEALDDSDRLLIPLLTARRRFYSGGPLILDQDSPSETLDRLLASNRAYWKSLDGPRLTRGEPRPLHLHWEPQGNEYRLQAQVMPDALILLLRQPWYLDIGRAEIGPLTTETAVRDAQWPLLFDAPPCSADEAMQVSQRLLAGNVRLPVPPPLRLEVEEIRDTPLTPVLRLLGFDDDMDQATRAHAAELRFRYGDAVVDPLPDTALSTVTIGSSRLVRVHRDSAAEEDAAAALHDIGMSELDNDNGPRPFVVRADNRSLSAAHWQVLLEEEFPRLRAAGWDIEVDDSFTLRFEDADLDGELESGTDWFALRYDLDVDGEKYPLAPLIAPLIDSLLHRPLEEWPEKVPLPLGRGRYLRVPREQLRPALEVLRELYNPEQLAEEDLKRSRFEAAALAALDSDRALRGARDLVELAKRLRDFTGIAPVPLPENLRAELRPYQQQGLNWLQFLREYGFNGVLADDMGLGKTLQTLAHLLIEKQAGRLDTPALVIAPTSLMGNWRREAERFTPDLKVVVMHGSDRHRHVRTLGRADVILSTYPLLSRDAEILTERTYHSVILDEAQNIKNPKTRAARVIRELKSRHRLCLTGTPMENHLGELWALFDFLMPGFLYDQREFKQRFRLPIEAERDPEARRLLTQRVQPFLLRRTKDAVVRELPPKTEIIRTATFDRAQAQLYESIRVAMDKRVREAIAAQGLARSHITILDALLKLRQTCCDPRLLKLDAARKVHHSAKLELLMEMLPELLEEGRRVLLFSQFTQMLALIEAELKAKGIDYAKLTGQTRHRDDAISRFTDGAVDVFLISLKAGGVGLNLPEADTVILYDPWWNPAVEAQAADRAHRIGQDKPVFVYKLLVENSVEETILGLQEHKRALAHALYSGKGEEGENLFDADNLRALFAPLADS